MYIRDRPDMIHSRHGNLQGPSAKFHFPFPHATSTYRAENTTNSSSDPPDDGWATMSPQNQDPPTLGMLSTTWNIEQPQQASNPDPAPHRVFHMEGECASPGDHKAVLAAAISRLGGRVVCLAVSRLSGNRPTSAETNRSSAMLEARCCRQLPIITITLRYSRRIKDVGRADNHPPKEPGGAGRTRLSLPRRWPLAFRAIQAVPIPSLALGPVPRTDSRLPTSRCQLPRASLQVHDDRLAPWGTRPMGCRRWPALLFKLPHNTAHAAKGGSCPGPREFGPTI